MNPFKKQPPENTVGIVIPMRNNLKYFKLAFHSVISFTDYPYMLTIINHMSDMPVRLYLRTVQANQGAAVMPYQEDFNYGAQVNLGLRYMFTFPGVAFGLVLNSDVVVEPRWLERMVDVFRRDSKIGVVGPVTNAGHPSQEIKRGRGHFKNSFLSGFCMMFKREVFETLGGFDEGYVGGGSEDADFCYRAVRAGWETAISRETYVHHFSRATIGFHKSADDTLRFNRERFERRFPELCNPEKRIPTPIK